MFLIHIRSTYWHDSTLDNLDRHTYLKLRIAWAMSCVFFFLSSCTAIYPYWHGARSNRRLQVLQAGRKKRLQRHTQLRWDFSRGSVGVLIHAFESWLVMITLTWNLCLREKKARSHTPLQRPQYSSKILFKISTKFQVHFLLLNLHICGSDLYNTLLPFRQHISTPANVLSFLWRILPGSIQGRVAGIAVLAGKPRLLFSAQTLPPALLGGNLRCS